MKNKLLLLLFSVFLFSCQKINKQAEERKDEQGEVYYKVGIYDVKEVTIKGHIYLLTYANGPYITLTHAGHCQGVHYNYSQSEK